MYAGDATTHHRAAGPGTLHRRRRSEGDDLRQRDPSADVSTTTSGRTTSQDELYGSSANPGVPVGRWFESIPWLGLALDASYFGPQNDIQVIPVSALIMARLAFMKDQDFPDGRLRPYAGVGPGLFVTLLDGDLGPFREVSDTTLDIGADARLGALFRVDEKIAVFTTSSSGSRSDSDPTSP